MALAHSLKKRSVIAVTFILAMMLSILPLPHWVVWLRPEWVGLVLIYWLMALPHRVSLGTAWVVGLLVDVLHGSILGEHAIAMSVIAYLAIKLHRQMRMFPIWQQAVMVMGLILIYQIIIAVIQGMLGQAENAWLCWLPAVVSMLLWPWIFVLLRDYRRRFQVY